MTFKVSGRVNNYNAVVRDTENSKVTYRLKMESTKVNIWYGVTRNKMHKAFFFAEETMFWEPYSDM